MSFLDLFRPKWDASNPRFRLAALKCIEDIELLKELASLDPNEKVRVAAQRKIDQMQQIQTFENMDEVRDIEKRTGDIQLTIPWDKTCDVCGISFSNPEGFRLDHIEEWKEKTGALARIKGLTCLKCGRTFCRQHLNQPMPEELPGGHCPSCGYKMNI